MSNATNLPKFLAALLLFACSNNAHQADTIKSGVVDSSSRVDTTLSKKTGTPVVETFIIHPTGYKDISKFEDSTINGIKLNDCETINKLFGKDFTLLPDIDDLPSLQILNADKTQMLTMFMWNGSASCDFSQYQIEYVTANQKFVQKPFTLDTKSFVSGRKIGLGMAQEDLKQKIGQPNEVRTEKGITILSYQEYNNLYFADYYFKANRLIKFRFGEEYP